MLYKLFYGLNGGFGGAINCQVDDCDSKEEAEDNARQLAYEDFEGYNGMYGLKTVEEIMEDEDCDEDYAQTLWTDGREDWIEYGVKPCDSDCTKCEETKSCRFYKE